jgi:hypothetical protein
MAINDDDGFEAAARDFYNMGPDFASCHVALIDALRDYIRYGEWEQASLLQEGVLTSEEARKNNLHLQSCRMVLREIEEFSFDETLCGVLPDRPT